MGSFETIDILAHGLGITIFFSAFIALIVMMFFNNLMSVMTSMGVVPGAFGLQTWDIEVMMMGAYPVFGIIHTVGSAIANSLQTSGGV